MNPNPLAAMVWTQMALAYGLHTKAIETSWELILRQPPENITPGYLTMLLQAQLNYQKIYGDD